MDSTGKTVKQLHEVTRKLLADGATEREIFRYLERKGIDRAYAEMIIANVESDKDDRRQHYKHLAYGIVLTLAGLALGIVNYLRVGSMWFYGFAVGILVYAISMIARAFIIFRPH